MENRQARRRVETGSDQVEIVAHAHDIGIGIVGVKNRITISAVSIICDPDFRRWCLRRCRYWKKKDQKDQKDKSPIQVYTHAMNVGEIKLRLAIQSRMALGTQSSRLLNLSTTHAQAVGTTAYPGRSLPLTIL